jgi:hypothetical protein
MLQMTELILSLSRAERYDVFEWKKAADQKEVRMKRLSKWQPKVKHEIFRRKSGCFLGATGA